MLHEIGNAFFLFLSTFVAVFALGFQSRNVNCDHEKSAFATSLVISVMNLVILKYAPNASPIEMAGYLAGGPFGIIAAMRAHKWVFSRKQKMEEGARNVGAGLPD